MPGIKELENDVKELKLFKTRVGNTIRENTVRSLNNEKRLNELTGEFKYLNIKVLKLEEKIDKVSDKIDKNIKWIIATFFTLLLSTMGIVAGLIIKSMG